jgi:uncharacterized protein (TIGR02147 family)
LEGAEKEYFLALVAFGQAGAEERSLRYKDLERFQHYRAAFRLDVTQDTYHSRWYLPAIRELVATGPFREDPLWIAQSLCPRISVEEAEAAIETLLQLGLLARDGNGRLQQASVIPRPLAGAAARHRLGDAAHGAGWLAAFEGALASVPERAHGSGRCGG